MTTSQITGTVGGVNLANGGYSDPVTVTATGVVTGGSGIGASTAWTIINYGSITGSNRAINLQAGGAITNAAGGTIGAEILANGAARVTNYGSIQGSFGIVLSGGDATIENAGTIGGHGYAVHFSGTGNNRLIVDAGAQFSGKVGANAAGVNTIELTSGASAGTLTGLGSQYTGFQTVTIDEGAAWTIAGTEAGFGGVTIDGFNNRDTLDLTDLGFTPGETATLDDATDVLTIKDAGGNALDTLQLAGDFTGDNFVLSGDGGNGLGIRLLKSQITGTVGGVNLANGGYSDPVTVTATGVVTGGSGIGASTAWTIINYGNITGSNRAINLQAGGAITNAAGGTISAEILANGPVRVTNHGSIQGSFGIVLSGGDATVENAGTIGGHGYAVHFSGTGSNRLIVDAGAQFSGKVAANAAGTNTIELTSGASAGTLTGLGSQYTGFQTVTIDEGAAWTIAGTEAGFGGVTVDGFNNRDTLDLTDLGFAPGETATLDGVTDILTIKDAGGNILDTLQLAGDFTGEFFHLADDGIGGTAITEDGTPCYCSGTMILTPGGEVAVEKLRIGDLVAVLSGAARSVKWIGHRLYSGRFARMNTEILPIRIAAGALEPGIPRRDLYVSPLHALYLDGILVPAWVLVNGTTIERIRGIDRVEYFHIELETHDVILAEGAPAETFLDDGSRGMFHNAAEFRALYPNDPLGRTRYCAPRLEDGEAVEAILNRLKLRAGLRAA